MRIATINTDAGFLHDDKVGAYAYWIKGDGLLLRGSGIFKEPATSATDAEAKAVVNALVLLEQSGYKPEMIIVNRDNMGVWAGKKKGELGKMMAGILKRIKLRSIGPEHPNYHGDKYYQFRHVKAHLHTKNPRHW